MSCDLNLPHHRRVDRSNEAWVEFALSGARASSEAYNYTTEDRWATTLA